MLLFEFFREEDAKWDLPVLPRWVDEMDTADRKQ